MRVVPGDRGTDKYGSGAFKASRGKRTHNGIDKRVEPDTKIYHVSGGIVTKLGYAYSDDLSFRYVQITSGNIDYRYFYIHPCVKTGQTVTAENCIGTSQKLGDRYPGITEHVHFEVKLDGAIVNPGPYLGE